MRNVASFGPKIENEKSHNLKLCDWQGPIHRIQIINNLNYSILNLCKFHAHIVTLHLMSPLNTLANKFNAPRATIASKFQKAPQNLVIQTSRNLSAKAGKKVIMPTSILAKAFSSEPALLLPG